MNFPAPLFALARTLLALMFVLAGFSKLGGLDGTAAYIASKGMPMPMVLAAGAALLEVLGGVALAVGYRTRLAAALLAAFTVLATLIFHAFWSMPADQAAMQQLMFMKNLSVIGGLLMVVGLGAGGCSIDSRRGKAA